MSEFSVPPKSSNSPSEIHCTMYQSTSKYSVIQNLASTCFKFQQETLIFVDNWKNYEDCRRKDKSIFGQ